MKYKVFSYRDDPRPMDGFLILGEIRLNEKNQSRSFFVVHDLTNKENYIRELITPVGKKNDGIIKGNILASIDDKKFWYQLFLIAKKEGILHEIKYDKD